MTTFWERAIHSRFTICAFCLLVSVHGFEDKALVIIVQAPYVFFYLLKLKRDKGLVVFFLTNE